MAGVNRTNQRIFWRGLTLGLAEGTQAVQVIEVDPRSPMANQGVRAGSVIRQFGGRPVSDLLTLQSLIDSMPPELARLDVAPGPVSANATFAAGTE